MMPMSDPDRLYTLTEAQQEMARRDCADDGHAPSRGVYTIDGPIALRYYCECGALTWARADDTEATP